MSEGIGGPATSKSLVPDEHALAFCFDVLSGAGSMGFASLLSLLRPWGWSRSTLLDRFHELQRLGLLRIEHPDANSQNSGIRVYITLEGQRLSEDTGLPFRRAILVLSAGQISGTIEDIEDKVSEQSTQPGCQP